MRKIIWTIIIVIILAAGGAAAYVWLAQPGKPTVKQQTTNTDSGSHATNTAVIIQTKTSTTVGQYLADGNGNPLYTYSGDSAGVSNCSGTCLYSWPIYEATTTTSLPANITIISRSDGSKQYAYKGMPLYGFSGDAGGDVHGDGISGFSVAKP